MMLKNICTGDTRDTDGRSPRRRKHSLIILHGESWTELGWSQELDLQQTTYAPKMSDEYSFQTIQRTTNNNSKFILASFANEERLKQLLIQK